MRYDNPEPGKYRLVVRPVEGGEGQESTLASGSKAIYYSGGTGRALANPAWSPDGKTIVCDESQHLFVLSGMLECCERGQFAVGRETKDPGNGQVRDGLRGPALDRNPSQLSLIFFLDVVHPAAIGRAYGEMVALAGRKLLQVAAR